MKKYLRLVCTICHRDIDKLVDLTHYSTDKCTITLGCEGRLQPIEYRSSGQIAVAPEAGVTDWRQRGTKATTEVALQDPVLINLATGSLNQVVIGALVDQPTKTITFNVKSDTPKDFRQYIFRQTQTFTTISGVEAGLAKKTLRFTAYGSTPDLVEVYVNGVKRDIGTGPDDFQVYDGTATAAVPPNTILFNTPISQSGTAQVDVIVSKEQAISTVNLVFTRNVLDESRVGKGAYENVDKISNSTKTFFVYRLDLATANIPVNSIIYPADTTEDIVFFLARAPYTQLDRYNDLIVPFQQLDEEVEYLKYSLINTVPTLQIVKTAVVGTYPQLKMTKFVVEKTIKVATAGVTEQIVIDGQVVTGPDA